MVEAYYNGGLKGAACVGKQSFADRASAAATAKRQKKRHVALTVYHCNFCGKWHLGSPKR